MFFLYRYLDSRFKVAPYMISDKHATNDTIQIPTSMEIIYASETAFDFAKTVLNLLHKYDLDDEDKFNEFLYKLRDGMNRLVNMEENVILIQNDKGYLYISHTESSDYTVVSTLTNKNVYNLKLVYHFIQKGDKLTKKFVQSYTNIPTYRFALHRGLLVDNHTSINEEKENTYSGVEKENTYSGVEREDEIKKEREDEIKKEREAHKYYTSNRINEYGTYYDFIVKKE